MPLLTDKSLNTKILKYTFFTMRLLTNKSLNKQILKCAFSSVPFLKFTDIFFIFHHHQPNKFNFLATKPNFTSFYLQILLLYWQYCWYQCNSVALIPGKGAYIGL